MIALIKLYFISWFRGFVGPFFSFAFPVLMLVLLGQFVPFSIIAPTYIAYAAVTLGIQSLSISLIQFKSSSLIKRIGQTSISRKQFIFSMLVFNFVLIILAAAVTLVAMYLLQHFDLVKITHYVKIPEFVDGVLELKEKAIDYSINWSLVQWKPVFMLLLIASFFSISVGLIISTVAKTTEKANGIGLIIYFIITFLSGIFFPLSQIKNSITLDRISVFMPLRVVAESLKDAFGGSFDIYKNFLMTIKSSGGIATKAMVLGDFRTWLFYPIVLGLIFIILSILLFKWE